MNLRIEIRGNLDTVIATAMPKAFLSKIFRRCMGKNNTPYFANNCFKGVLYFDAGLAAKYAKDADYQYLSWDYEPRFFRHSGYSFERYMDIAVLVDGKYSSLSAMVLSTNAQNVEIAPLLPQVADDEVLLTLGSVDKGVETWTLEGAPGPFDPDKLLLNLLDLEDFRLTDKLITEIRYDGKALARQPGKHTGKNMLTPVLFSNSGAELDLYDFMGLDVAL